jgi:hypothetical protein
VSPGSSVDRAGRNTNCLLYYNGSGMKTTVQARLNAEDQRKLTHLVHQLGWSPSRIVREGLDLLAASHPAPGRSRIAGLGKFSSGKPDLGSNKKHLKGFGK